MCKYGDYCHSRGSECQYKAQSTATLKKNQIRYFAREVQQRYETLAYSSYEERDGRITELELELGARSCIRFRLEERLSAPARVKRHRSVYCIHAARAPVPGMHSHVHVLGTFVQYRQYVHGVQVFLVPCRIPHLCVHLLRDDLD